MATLAQNIQRAINDFNSIENAIVQKGVPVPDGTPTSEYGEKILSIETGVDTSGDTVVPSALREGYTAHNAAGQEITGTIPDYSGGNTVEMTSPECATLNTAGTYCEGNIEVVPKLQSKTATTGEIVTADDGYVGLSEVDTNPVFEAGKKSEHDAFWEETAKFGGPPTYGWQGLYMFAGKAWTEKNFRPPYDIVPGNANYMFAANNIRGDFAAILDELGITIDFSKTKAMSNCFSYSLFTKIPKLNVPKCTNFGNAFANASVLVEISFEEDCINANIDFKHSPLNKASLASVVNGLSTTTTGLTVTLHLSAVNTAFETTAGAADGSTSDEWTALIATKPNWTINLINS